MPFFPLLWERLAFFRRYRVDSSSSYPLIKDYKTNSKSNEKALMVSDFHKCLFYTFRETKNRKATGIFGGFPWLFSLRDDSTFQYNKQNMFFGDYFPSDCRFINSSNSILCFFATTCRIRPQANNSAAMIKHPTQTNRVGKRGTCPIRK